MRTIHVEDIEKEEKVLLVEATEETARILHKAGYKWNSIEQTPLEYKFPPDPCMYYLIHDIWASCPKSLKWGTHDNIEEAAKEYENKQAEAVKLHMGPAPISSSSPGQNNCPVCGSSGRDMVFQFYCFNETCQNYRK